MKCKYLFLVLIVSSCSESINVQYEVNDNVSSKQFIINCEYTKKGDDGWKKTFCDNEPEGENRPFAFAKVFDNSPAITAHSIESVINLKRCKDESTATYKCPIGVSPAQTSSPYWDGDTFVKGVVQQDVSWVYDILSNNYSKTYIKFQLAEVEKKFNIKIYPPSLIKSDGILIGRTDDIYDFYVSEYSKHSKPQAEKKLCEFNRVIASNIIISHRVLPELATVVIDKLNYGYNSLHRSDTPFAGNEGFTSLVNESKYCADWSPYLVFEPKFVNPSDGMSLSEMAYGKEIKITIDINPQNYNLDNLAKEIIKKSSGYCVYKQFKNNEFRVSYTVPKDNISTCRTTCHVEVLNVFKTIIFETLPTKFQYSVSHHEINRGEYDKNDLPKSPSVEGFGEFVRYEMESACMY